MVKIDELENVINFTHKKMFPVLKIVSMMIELTVTCTFLLPYFQPAQLHFIAFKRWMENRVEPDEPLPDLVLLLSKIDITLPCSWLIKLDTTALSDDILR